MKRTIAFLIALCIFVSLKGQTVTEGTKWFDGNVLYVAYILNDGEVFFSGKNGNDEIHEFTLRRMNYAPGEYILIPSNMEDDAPFRAQFGWRVQYIRQEGMYFLAVRNRQDRVVWTLTLTPDTLDNCLAQQESAEEMPVEEILTSFLFNTKLLAGLNKNELQLLFDKLQADNNRDIIAKTNLDLLASELEVVDYERFALINDGLGQSYSEETKAKRVDYFALVTSYRGRQNAIEYLSFMDCPSPWFYGIWNEYEITFVIVPAEEDSVLELWNARLDEDNNVVKNEFLLLLDFGMPLVLSYIPPDGLPEYVVVCRKSDGSTASWIPQFSGRDGSLVTDSDFINGEPVG